MDGLIFNTYKLLLLGVNATNVVPNNSRIRECRCCHEVPEALHKLLFDASIEKFKCVTQHEDFAAMTNRTVLTQVRPMLKDRNGKGYRRRTGQSENEYVK